MITFESLGLVHLADDPLYQKYLVAANYFVEKELPKFNCTHAFILGSFVRGELKDGSDLDFDIVAPSVTKHTVGSITIDGIKVEYALFSHDMLARSLAGTGTEPPIVVAKAILEWKMVKGDSFPSELADVARNILKK